MLEAWVNAGMSAPHEMASATIMVPEPGAFAMLAAGVTMLVGLRVIRQQGQLIGSSAPCVGRPLRRWPGPRTAGAGPRAPGN
jgi:hypothetical protein